MYKLLKGGLLAMVLVGQEAAGNNQQLLDIHLEMPKIPTLNEVNDKITQAQKMLFGRPIFDNPHANEIARSILQPSIKTMKATVYCKDMNQVEYKCLYDDGICCTKRSDYSCC